MKRYLMIAICILLVLQVACSAPASSTTDAEPATPPATVEPDVVSHTEALNAVNYAMNNNLTHEVDLDALGDFAYRLYELCAADQPDNYAMSPLSVYMALAVLHGIADQSVRRDIQSFTGMSAQDLDQTGQLFLSLVNSRTYNGQQSTMLDINNSLWLDTRLQPNRAALERMAEQYYCRAYATPFYEDVVQANQDITRHIKEMTHDMIDADFDLPADTALAIINTLYYCDVWTNGTLRTEQRAFYAAEEKECTYLVGAYTHGVAGQNEVCSFYQAYTMGGYRLTLVLPNEGCRLQDAMRSANLTSISRHNNYVQDDKYIHYTRCIFPAFDLQCDTPLGDILEANDLLPHAFAGYRTDLIDMPMTVTEIKHKVALSVDEDGIEGAAVTIIINKLTSADPSNMVHHDFVLDRPFGFVISNADGVVLFAGQIVNP